LAQKLLDLEGAQSSLQRGLAQGEIDLAAAIDAVAAAGQRTAAGLVELEDADKERAVLDAKLREEEQSALAAEEHLTQMVAVDEVHKHEAECRRCREELKNQDKEARQFRVALAEALSTGTDLPNTMQELTLLKESTSAANARVQSLQELNEQIQTRIADIEKQNSRLRKGAFDLQNESELMRDVIMQQNDELLRKVDDLTEERKTADADRKQLLSATADLMSEVDSAEARIAQRPKKEIECARIQANQETVTSEVERLRRTNLALAQQIFGEDGDGPFAGVLQPPFGSEGELRNLYDEVSRLLRGQPLQSAHGSLQADSAALSLRVQQVLAEREEAFWLERQRLSDRCLTLERARGGRTGNLLREYDAAARGATPASSGAAAGSSKQGALSESAGASLAAVSGLAATAGASAATAATEAAEKAKKSFNQLKGVAKFLS